MGIIYFIFRIIFFKETLNQRNQMLLLLIYLGFILVLSFRPIPNRSYNIIPFSFIKDLQYDIRQVILFVGNILVYVPVGYFGWKYLKNDVIKFTFLLLISLFVIEIIQYIFILGVFDIDDILLNYFGSLLGYLSLKCYKKHKK